MIVCMLNHGVSCNLGSAKVCSPAIFDISLMTMMYGLLQLITVCTFI